MPDMTPQSSCRYALDHFTDHKTEYLDKLKNLVQIPSISFPGFPPAPVKESAEAIAKLLRETGLDDVRILETGGHPAVFAQSTKNHEKLTLLLYAHHDVQPVGREDLWVSAPFEPTVRNDRLYGRGVSDDKAGAMMHIAAIGSYLQSSGDLPVNIKVLIEGEEEVSSVNLATLIQKNKQLLQADAVVIADSENFEDGVPTLTASLRGIVTVTVEVRSLSSSVHSGTWGGPVPDPVLALSKMLSSLVDAQGKAAIPGLLDKVRALSPDEKSRLEKLPFSESRYRTQTKILENVPLLPGTGTAYEKMWHLPSIAVNAIEASSRKQAANIINDVAWARVGVRIVADMDPQETTKLLKDHLLRHAPWGVQVVITPENPSPWWTTDTKAPAFQAALTALEKGFGKKPLAVGAGGSIPFVQTITQALNNAPALLFGVGDPYSAAHSENESLSLLDWEKSCKSLIYFFDEFAHANH